MVNALPSEPFKAHWDHSFGRYAPTLCSRVSQFALNFFSIILPLIGLTRYVINPFITKLLVLPSSELSAAQISDKRTAFKNTWDNFSAAYHFNMTKHTVETPDGALLNVIHFAHQDANEETPTIVYFNPNAAISYDMCYLSLMNQFREQNIPCHFVCFDYRGTGDSKGVCRTFHDLPIDGASVIQWVKEKLGVRKDLIHFYGYSLGAAVATEVKGLAPSETPGKFVSERSLSSTDDFIATAKRAPWVLVAIAQKISQWMGQSFNVMSSFRKHEGEKLVIFHREDPIIKYEASVHAKVPEERHIELEATNPQEKLNHHCQTLSYYKDKTSNRPAMEKVTEFLFGN